MSHTDLINLGCGWLSTAPGNILSAFGYAAEPFAPAGGWLVTSWRLLGAGGGR
jgi:hypothetical protein